MKSMYPCQPWLAKMALNDPMCRPKLLPLGRISHVCNHSRSMAFPSLMFIEHNHMMHFDNRPIFVRNNRTCCIRKTTLVDPPTWFVMMFNKICFIRSKSIFFYLYHFFTSLVPCVFWPTSRPLSFHHLNSVDSFDILLELDFPNFCIIKTE